MTKPIVWRLSAEDSAEAGSVLGRAFMDDPMLAATFPDLAAREPYFRERWAALARYACRFGEAWAVGATPGEMAGVLLWVRIPSPDRTPELKSELAYPPSDPVVDAAMTRLQAMLEQAETGYGEMPPVWRSVEMIGIEPARQGQGLGSALLRHLLADAEAAGEVVALVTDQAVNVAFYERAGMDLVWTGTSDDGALPLWSFRTPSPA